MSTRIGYFDCSAGVAGNMILGSLFDAGLDEKAWRRQVARLRLPVAISINRVKRQGIAATYVKVTVPRHGPARGLKEVTALIRRAKLGPAVTARSLAIFERLARAEAKVHGVALDRVHFHEVGGYDCIADIVGAVLGFGQMGIEHIYASAINLGRGTVIFSHGTFAVPAPATADLLKGVPVYQPAAITGELATPTGAAILRELVEEFGPMPPMQIEHIGYGAGNSKPELPNILRLAIGTSASGSEPVPHDEIVQIETNIDDMNPELFGYVMERLFAEGALDVYFTPIYMKKNRPATLLSVIAQPERLQTLTRTILSETTSLGVRYRPMSRTCLERRVISVRTRYGSIKVKLGILDGKPVTVAPEYESCRATAVKRHVPLKRIYEEAEKKVRAGN